MSEPVQDQNPRTSLATARETTRPGSTGLDSLQDALSEVRGDVIQVSLFLRAIGILVYMLPPKDRSTWYVVRDDLVQDIAEMKRLGYSQTAICFIVAWRSTSEIVGLFRQRFPICRSVMEFVRKLLRTWWLP